MSKAVPAVTVRELTLSDMPRFQTWGHHSDPRFFHYDFPALQGHEHEQWYRAKKIPFFRWVYIAEDAEGHLLGYMTVKRINRILRRGELGIVFDPARLGQGYGTAAMVEFLRLYFDRHRMLELRLRVAAFNERAQRAYEKVGFERYATRMEAFEEQGRNFELILGFPQDFSMDGDVMLAQFHLMKITRDRFRSLHGK